MGSMGAAAGMSLLAVRPPPGPCLIGTFPLVSMLLKPPALVTLNVVAIVTGLPPLT
jgi:hypothetical protein